MNNKPIGTLPRFLYHRANPIFRSEIEKLGLVPKVGESYKMYWEDHFPDSSPEPAIFLFDGSHMYDSTYDDDLVRVDTSALDPEHLKRDPAESLSDWCFMYDRPIPPDAISIIYRGTGNSGDAIGIRTLNH